MQKTEFASQCKNRSNYSPPSLELDFRLPGNSRGSFQVTYYKHKRFLILYYSLILPQVVVSLANGETAVGGVDISAISSGANARS